MSKAIPGAIAVIMASSAVQAGVPSPIPVSEPGMIGIIAGGVIAALAFARLRGRK